MAERSPEFIAPMTATIIDRYSADTGRTDAESPTRNIGMVSMAEMIDCASRTRRDEATVGGVLVLDFEARAAKRASFRLSLAAR